MHAMVPEPSWKPQLDFNVHATQPGPSHGPTILIQPQPQSVKHQIGTLWSPVYTFHSIYWNQLLLRRNDWTTCKNLPSLSPQQIGLHLYLLSNTYFPTWTNRLVWRLLGFRSEECNKRSNWFGSFQVSFNNWIHHLPLWGYHHMEMCPSSPHKS